MMPWERLCPGQWLDSLPVVASPLRSVANESSAFTGGKADPTLLHCWVSGGMSGRAEGDDLPPSAKPSAGDIMEICDT